MTPPHSKSPIKYDSWVQIMKENNKGGWVLDHTSNPYWWNFTKVVGNIELYIFVRRQHFQHHYSIFAGYWMLIANNIRTESYDMWNLTDDISPEEAFEMIRKSINYE